MRSSLLLVRALQLAGIAAWYRSGRPGRDDASTEGPGLLTADGWVRHAWVEAANMILDITGDQFGHSPVLVLPVTTPTYRPGWNDHGRLEPSSKAIAAVERAWLHFDQEGRENGRAILRSGEDAWHVAR